MKGNSEGDSLGFLGYCPQENVLWPNLSVREHLEVFAAIKGLKKGDATVTITRYVGRDTRTFLGGCDRNDVHRELRKGESNR